MLRRHKKLHAAVIGAALLVIGSMLAPIRSASAAACTEWAEGNSFVVGQVVTYQGLPYTAIQAHTAYAANWTPPNVPALWGPAGVCDSPVGTVHEVMMLGGENTVTMDWRSRNINGSSVGLWQIFEGAVKVYESTRVLTFPTAPDPGCTTDCFSGVTSMGDTILFNVTAGTHTYVVKLCNAAGTVCNNSAPQVVPVRAPTLIPLSTIFVPGPCAGGTAFPTWAEGQNYEASQLVFARTGQFLVQFEVEDAFTGIFVANESHRSSVANEPIVFNGRPQWNPFWHYTTIKRANCPAAVPPLGPVTFNAVGGINKATFSWLFDSVFGNAMRWQIWEGTMKVLDSTAIDARFLNPTCQTIVCKGPAYRAGSGAINAAPGSHSYVLRLCDAAGAMCSTSAPKTVTVTRR